MTSKPYRVYIPACTTSPFLSINQNVRCAGNLPQRTHLVKLYKSMPNVLDRLRYSNQSQASKLLATF